MLSQGQQIQLKRYQEFLGDAEIKEVMRILKERKFSAKDLGISYRELNHWSSLKLLYESNAFGKKRLFSTIEIVWIEIFKELRLYKFPLDAIKVLKESLEVNYHIDDMPAEFHEKALEVVKIQMGDDFDTDFVKEFIRSGEYKEAFETFNLNMFELLIFDVYFLKLNYRLLVANNGSFGFYSNIHHDELTKIISQHECLDRSHISISLGVIIARIFGDFKIEELKTKWMLIDEKEEKVLSMMRSPWEIKAITVRFNSKAEIDLIEHTKILKITPRDYLKKVMLAGGYERIEVITQKGDIVYCEKTTREKL